MKNVWIILCLLLIWYGTRAVRENPIKPNWSKALVAVLFWPLSLFFIKWSKHEEKGIIRENGGA